MGRKLINDNVNTVLKILFNRLGLRYGADILENMKEHPDFPSFLSFQHSLKKEGVGSIALRVTIEQLRAELPKPVLVHVVTNTDLFLLVNKVDDVNVHIINEQGEFELESIEKFVKIWNGNAMIFDSENITQKAISFKEKVLLLLNKIRIYFILFAVLSMLTLFLVRGIELRSICEYLFMIFSLVGLLFSILLLIENFDEQNPLVRKICSSAKSRKVSCSSILNSKDAYFLGILSWSDIGFVYFMLIFMLNLLLPSGFSLLVSVLISILSFPYVFYSITYQKFVARSWCRLCLGVQAMLTALFIVAILSFRFVDFKSYGHIRDLLPTIILLIVISAAYMAVKPLLAKLYELRAISSNYRLLKHNHGIKQLIFQNQPLVTSASGCCLIIGNSNGASCVTLVISPVCNPCMKELNTLLPILRGKQDTRIEILFFTDKKEEDPLAFNLAKRLIGEYLSEPNLFIDVLNDYVNNYPASRFRYDNPLATDEAIEQRLLEQIKWCIDNDLYSTPKIFIDGRALPSFYTVKEIDYMCS